MVSLDSKPDGAEWRDMIWGNDLSQYVNGGLSLESTWWGIGETGSICLTHAKHRAHDPSQVMYDWLAVRAEVKAGIAVRPVPAPPPCLGRTGC